jgi:AraC-like DNA-binding protein
MLPQDMLYETYQPSDILKSFVRCYWTLDAPAQAIPEKQRIVPDGCMEMIFHYGDRYKQYVVNGEAIVQPVCFVFGQITQALDIEPTGQTGIFSVRFQPEGFYPFSTLPLEAMDDQAVPLKDLYQKEGAILEEQMLTATSTQQRINIVEKFLIERLHQQPTIDHIVKKSVELLFSWNGQLTINDISQEAKISKRQLERRFSHIVGLSPKKLARIIRLQATLRMLLNRPVTSLTALAYEGEYYDQAHFIKDFKEFTGLTPKQFYADNLKLSALFYRAE